MRLGSAQARHLYYQNGKGQISVQLSESFNLSKSYLIIGTNSETVLQKQIIRPFITSIDMYPQVKCMAIARFEISKRSENWRNGMAEFDLDLRFRLTAKSYLFYSSLTLPLQSNSGFLPLRGGGGGRGAP